MFPQRMFDCFSMLHNQAVLRSLFLKPWHMPLALDVCMQEASCHQDSQSHAGQLLQQVQSTLMAP